MYSFCLSGTNYYKYVKVLKSSHRNYQDFLVIHLQLHVLIITIVVGDPTAINQTLTFHTVIYHAQNSVH